MNLEDAMEILLYIKTNNQQI